MNDPGKNRQKKAYINALCLYLFCLPLNAMRIGSFGSLLKVIAFIPVCIAFFRLRLMRSYEKCILNQLVFLVFACSSILWSVEKGMSFDRVITYILLNLLIFTATFFDYDNHDIDKIKNAFLWSSRTTAIVLLLFSNFSQGRWFLRGLISEDPNYLCCYIISGIILLLQRIQNHEKKSITYIELIGYLVLVVATGSRGGLLAVIAGIAVFFMSNKGFSIGYLFKLIGIAILIIIIFVVVIRFMPESLQDRFSLQNVINSQGTGRIAIWAEGIRVFNDSPIIRKVVGYGTGSVTTMVRILEYGKDRGYAMHNIYLEYLLELGLAGLLLYIVSIVSFVKKASSFTDKFSFSVIISMIVLSLSTSLHTFKPYFNIMLFIIIMIYKTNSPMVARQK